MEKYRRGDLMFDVLDVGPADGPVVVLLHGFPQFNTCWSRVIPPLVAHGYRCLAPNQRGYSPGARPTRRRDYRVSELVDDVRALIDASGAQRVHLVGHDWGAAVTWAAAALYPDCLKTISALSMPHPAAFFRAFATSRQAALVWHLYFFQLPWLPELLMTRRAGDSFLMARGLRWSHQTRENARRDATALIETGALTAALNWYRAVPLSYLRQTGQPKTGQGITVPALYVWSDADTALESKAARDTAHYVAGEYRFEVLHGVSHWIPDERPETVAELLLEWFAGHPS